MKRGVLADTGPLFAAVDQDDQYHPRARNELARLARERRPIVVSYTTLVEGQGLILRRIGIAASTAWLAQVVADAVLIAPEDGDFLAAIALLGGYPDQRLTLADAVVAALAERLALPVWTYDHHFDVMGVPVWR